MQKRIFDYAGAGLIFLGLLALLPFIATAIKLDSPGPIFFCQERVGKGGKRIKVWKFRTLLEGTGCRSRERLVRRGDPRVTRVGRILRALHIDELVQVLNILVGLFNEEGREMSLVGARPVTPEISEARKKRDARYQDPDELPGIFGPRANSREDEWDKKPGLSIELEREYERQCSVWLDLRIIYHNVRIILFGLPPLETMAKVLGLTPQRPVPVLGPLETQGAAD